MQNGIIELCLVKYENKLLILLCVTIGLHFHVGVVSSEHLSVCLCLHASKLLAEPPLTPLPPANLGPFIRLMLPS